MNPRPKALLLAPGQIGKAVFRLAGASWWSNGPLGKDRFPLVTASALGDWILTPTLPSHYTDLRETEILRGAMERRRHVHQLRPRV